MSRSATVESLAGSGWSDTVQHLHDTKAGHAIGGVLCPPERGQHVLDVGGLHKFQPAELNEGNVAAGELDLQHGAMVGGAEQDRLLLEGRAVLTIAQHRLDNEIHLPDVVGHRDQRRFCVCGAGGPQVLCEALARSADDGVGGGQDRLRGAVVLFQCDGPRCRSELVREVEDVAHVGSPEAVDCLRIVAHNCEPSPIGLETKEDRSLQGIGVLILIDQHMVEVLTHFNCELRHLHELAPVEQQVVVIEHLLALLGLDIGLEQIAQRVLPFRAPRKLLQQHTLQGLAGIHRTRVDGKAGGLEREALVLFGLSHLVPHQVHQVGGVLPVMNGERRVEANGMCVSAQQAGTDGMESSGPADAHVRCGRAQRSLYDPLGAALHLGGGAAREGQQQDAPRVGPVHDQVRDTVGERVGLARPRAADDQQRARDVGAMTGNAVLDGAALLGIEALEVVGVRHPRVRNRIRDPA